MGSRWWFGMLLLSAAWQAAVPTSVFAQYFEPHAMPTASPNGQPANGSYSPPNNEPGCADRSSWPPASMPSAGASDWPVTAAPTPIWNQPLQPTYAPSSQEAPRLPPPEPIPPGTPAGTPFAAPAPASADPRITPYQVVMAAGTVTGRLLNKGHPLVNCHVVIVPMHEQSGAYGFDPERQVLNTTTDDRGEYRFANVVPGAYKLTWLPQGETRWIRRISMHPDVMVRAGQATNLKDIRVALQTIN